MLLQEVQVLKDSAQDNHKSAESAVAAINADLEKAKLEHGSAVAKLAQFEIQYESDLQKARDSVEDFKLEKAEAIAELTIKLVILNTQLKSLTEEHNQALIKLQVSEEMLAKLRDTECQLNNQKSEYALGLESKVAEMEAQLEAKATQMHGIEVAAEEKAANNEKQLASANASLSGLQEQLLVQQNKPIQNSETNTDSFVLSDQGCNTDLVSLCHMETSTHATVMQDASIEVQLDLECIKEIFDGKLNVAESVQDPLIVTNLEVSLAEQQEKNTALSRDAKAKSQQLDDMTVKYLDAAKERESLKNRLQALKATLSERASPIVTLATTPKSNENEKLASNTLVDTSTALPEISKYKRRRPSDAGLEGQASRPKTDSPKPESKTIFSPQISKLAANLIPRWATRKAPEADTQQSDDRLKEQLDQQKKKSNSKVDKDSDCNQQ